MYVCRTFESTVTIVDPPVGEGECDMMPHPSLFAEPSMPRARRGRDGLWSGDCFMAGSGKVKWNE